MKKDYLRDYATAAFRFYAQHGMSAERYKEKIYNEALEEISKREVSVKDEISKPAEAALMAAEKAVNEKIAEIKDMEAVDKVMAELKGTTRPYIAKAIELVYFKDHEKEFSIGDIQNRVVSAGMEIGASERSLYYWLKQARVLFAYHRGLRV